LSSLLSLANVPHCLIHCHALTCVDHDHFDIIEDYCNSIVIAVDKATAIIVPPATADRDKMRVPGWSDYAQEKYDIARDAYMSWLYAGKPRSGFYHYTMC